jgi:hypothetical protein
MKIEAIVSLHFLFCLSVRLTHCLPAVSEENDEDEECEMKDGSKGTCKVADECPFAQDYVNNRDKFVRCGFQGIKMVLCCPKKIEPTIKSTVRDGLDFSEILCENEVEKSFEWDFFRALFLKIKMYSINFFKLNSIHDRIVYGVRAAVGEFPHMAALGYEKEDGEIEYGCGGTLISKSFVLTAAHCIIYKTSRKLSLVRLGKVNYAEFFRSQSK